MGSTEIENLKHKIKQNNYQKRLFNKIILKNSMFKVTFSFTRSQIWILTKFLAI